MYVLTVGGPNTSCQGIDGLGSPLICVIFQCSLMMLTDATSFKCAARSSDLLYCLDQVLLRKEWIKAEVKKFKTKLFFYTISIETVDGVDSKTCYA
jgi:hypothetical protein